MTTLTAVGAADAPEPHKLTEAESADLFLRAAEARLVTVREVIRRTPAWKIRTLYQLVDWERRLVAAIGKLRAARNSLA